MKHTKTNIVLATVLATVGLATLAPITIAAGITNGINIQAGQGQEQIILEGKPSDIFLENLLIQNTGNQKTTLRLYLQDAIEENSQFALKTTKADQADMTDWISLNSRELALEAGETKSIPISIKFPENAGIGKHFAAIMASQRIVNSEGNVINLDTGIRVHATVIGATALSKYKLLNSRQETVDGKFIYQTTVINTGNTDLKGEISLANQATSAIPGDKTSIILSPGEDQSITLQTSKSSLGSEHIVATFNLNNDLKTFVLSSGFIFPLSETLLLLFLGLGLTVIMVSRKKLSAGKVNLLVFLLIAVVTTGLVVGQTTIAHFLQTNIFGPDEEAYLTTIKWGSFQDELVPEGTTTNWSGRLSISDGQIFLVEKLHNEQTDQIEINATRDSVNFRNTTGSDNDGIIVLIKTPANSPAVLVYHNNLTGEEIKVPLKNTFNSARYIQYKQQQVEIKSEPAPDLIELISPAGIVETPLAEVGETQTPIQPIIEIESTPDNTIIIEDLEATGNQSLLADETILSDEEATPQAGTETTEEDIIIDLQATLDQARLMEEIKLLGELIKDLPSSPDVISEYIFNSSFISSVTSDINSTSIIGSSKLIRLLKDTPLIIKEITSTPDTNFLFLPNDTIKLGTQSFSFNERKLSSQELNEIVFVQKKTIPWTVYFSISNLTSISGGDTISSTNITFTPGDVEVVSQSGETPLIEPGNERKMTNQGDLIKLFSVTPQDGSQVIFSMKPRISVFVPPNTLPGLYRAEITFKAI